MTDDERIQLAVANMRKMTTHYRTGQHFLDRDDRDDEPAARMMEVVLASAYGGLANTAPEGSGWNNFDPEVTETPESQALVRQVIYEFFRQYFREESALRN